MDLYINHSVRVKQNHFTKDGAAIAGVSGGVDNPDEVYWALGSSYLKFFKMDELCKWSWLGAEALLKSESGYVHDSRDKTNTAIVLATKHGCLGVDKRYAETMRQIASPALFVYTLPNIALGEIAIRHGFKGEQACLVQDAFDAEEIYFWVHNIFSNNNTDACLCGWADAYDGHFDASLFWVTNKPSGKPFTISAMRSVYGA